MERYYWLKLKRDFFKRHDIKILKAQGDEYVVTYLSLMCESIDHDGRLRFSDDVPYTPEMLAVVTDTDPAIINKALSLYMSLGLMVLEDDGTYFIPDIDKMTGSAVNNDNAKRQKRYRDAHSVTKNNASVTDSVTKSNATVTHGVTNNNESIEYRDKSIDINNICPFAKDVIAYLNSKLGTNYRPSTKKTIQAINARHREGYTYDDFVKVIDKKYNDWHDDEKMKQYLTPDTLFGTKFEKYLNQPVKSTGSPQRKGSFFQFEKRNDYDFNAIDEIMRG